MELNNVNTKISNLKKNIIEQIVNSNLPVGVCYYILKDLYIDMLNTFEESIKLEQQISEVQNSSFNKEDSENKQEN